jgi:alkylation response protein AidB-like acyl-CoA dehydrogenase
VDLGLSDEQAAVVELFGALGTKWSTPEIVRAHEELGFAPALWDQLVAAGAPGMAVAAEHGGGGSGLLELALGVEQLGRALAPAPLVEHAVAARLLTAVGAELPEGVVEGTAIATIALRPAGEGVARLVPAGAVAHHVVALDGDRLVLVSSDPPGAAVPNLASMPLADRALTYADGTTLATGDAAHACFAAALTEWRALTAAALTGLGAAALELACAYVTERHQFGVPIGSFQAIQHGLADVSVGLDGAQLLARKAAWTLDRPDPGHRASRRAGHRAGHRAGAADLAAMAFLFAAEQAQTASTRALHYHGGYGFMEEYDVQLLYRRAKGWALVLDDPALEYRRVAASRYPSPAAAIRV